MGKKKSTETMEKFMSKVGDHINVEPHLDPIVIEKNGFFRRAVTTAGLWKFVTLVPTKILAKAIAEILLNLKKEQNTSSFTNPRTRKPVEVDMSKLIEVFDLPREGGDSLLDLGLSAEVQYGRFAADGADPNFKEANIRKSLKNPFNLICELFTKSIACYVGSLDTLSETKLIGTTMIVDSLTGTKFNWHGWLLKQIHEAADDFAFVPGTPDKILRKGKLKFFARLSVALELKYPEIRWPDSDMAIYTKHTVFYEQWKKTKIPMDRGLLVVEVPAARQVMEAQAEASRAKRTASPLKQAAAKQGKKKLKQDTSSIQESEAAEKPLEENEVNESQSSPTQANQIPETEQTQPVTKPTHIPDTPETTPFQSPPTSAGTADTAHTSILSQFQISKTPTQMNALKRYKRDREQAAETLRTRYPSVPMSNDFFTKMVDFLTYVTYRGTEFYKVFKLLEAFSKEDLIQMEGKLLDFIGENGFHAFLTGTSFWDTLDAKVKRAYPNAKVPEHTPTIHEKKLMRDHAEEMEVKTAEISSVQDEITKKKMELEEKERELETQVKLVKDLKGSRDEERSRLRVMNTKLVTVGKEKEMLEKEVKELKKKVEKKEAELVMKESELLSTKKTLDLLRTQLKEVKEESAIDKRELESLRSNAQALDLKKAELSEEHVFASRTEDMFHAVLDKIEELHKSFTGKTIVPTPGFDDAKKGEGMVLVNEGMVLKNANLLEPQGGVIGAVELGNLLEESSGTGEEESEAKSAKKGKEKLTEEEPLKKPEEPRKPLGDKVLASSIARHPPVTVLTKEERRKLAEASETMERQFNLKFAGTSSSQAPTSAEAPTSAVAPASSAALTSAITEVIPSTDVTQIATTKRNAPETKKDDSASKRQKVEKVVTSKAEKEKKIRTKRLQIIDERIEKHFNEMSLIQSVLVRSILVPITPEESDACLGQAMIDTCHKTAKEMFDSGRYPLSEERNYIRKQLNQKLPHWSGESGKKFKTIIEQMTSRSEEELAVRRDEHPDAREIEQFIPDELHEQWLHYKEKFIKAYYYWEVVPLQTECSRITALNNFLIVYDEKFRQEVFALAQFAEPAPIIIKVPAKKEFLMPFLPGTSIINRSIIDAEVDEAFQLEETWRIPSIHSVDSMEAKVFSAYTISEEMIAKDLEEVEEVKRMEEKRKKKEEDETAGNL